jgi:hypothetical protein
MSTTENEYAIKPKSADVVTSEHIARVRELLALAADTLYQRGLKHDLSKYDSIESGPLQEMQDLIDREGHAPYGSDEYKRRTALLGPMLQHHYENNSHHPEHYANGVAGMDLFDLVEMFFDWKAASERGQDYVLNLTILAQKYSLPPMLESILRNTAVNQGYKQK